MAAGLLGAFTYAAQVLNPARTANADILARFAGPLDLLLALDPTAVETPALRLVSNELVTAYEKTRTDPNPLFNAISMGPQEGKSTLIAFAYPIWLLMRRPDWRIVIVSYEKMVATRWGLQARDAINAHADPDAAFDFGLRLAGGAKAASDSWRVAGHKGGVYCVGLDGGITGRPADVVILDDLVKDRRQAQSAAFKNLWAIKWSSAIRPRLAPRALVVMDHTRWAQDDPIGQQTTDHGDRWRYLNIPALSKGAGDPLGRPAGVWLISARGRTPAQWEQTRADVGEQDFAALYQGEPSPAAGGLFKRALLRFWHPTDDPWTVKIPGRVGPDVRLEHSYRFITVDLAASMRDSADWTVAAVWAIADTGELLLIDLARAKVDPAEHWDKVVRPLWERWSPSIFLEGSQYGTDLAYTIGREGIPLQPLEADTDKYTRAMPAARRAHQGMILLPQRAHWLPDFIDEVVAFPNGQHDDQVDVLAYAHRVVGAYWMPDQHVSGMRSDVREPMSSASGWLGDAQMQDPQTAVF